MTDQFHRDDGDDDRLDRTLRAALTIEPSPAFRARVRARIGSEPVPATGRSLTLSWTGAGAAAAIAMFLLVASIATQWKPQDSRQSGPPAVPQMRTAVALFSYPNAVAQSGRSPSSINRAATARAIPQQPVTIASAVADAQFAPRDREAFALLFALSRTGNLPLIEAVPIVTQDQQVAIPAIQVPLIVIPTLEAAPVVEGEPQ